MPLSAKTIDAEGSQMKTLPHDSRRPGPMKSDAGVEIIKSEQDIIAACSSSVEGGEATLMRASAGNEVAFGIQSTEIKSEEGESQIRIVKDSK